MVFSFYLSMPSVASWDGNWSGNKKFYALTRSIRGKKGEDFNKSLEEKNYFTYNFGDGWRAAVRVEKVDGKQAAKIRRKSDGFNGYDWMVDSIIDNGDIICD